MRLEALMSEVTAMHGWQCVTTPDNGYKIEVPTEPGRSQVVEITRAKDPDGAAIAFIWSNVTHKSNVGDPYYLLKLNAELSYGALALHGEQIILKDSQLIDTADSEEIERSVRNVAKRADALEKLVHGAHDAN